MAILALAGCAKSGDQVSDEGIAELAGLLQSDWKVDHPVKVQTGEQIVKDGTIQLALEQTGVSDAVIDPLGATGSTDDPGGATVDVLITVNTVKNGNGVLVRRNTSGTGTRCFRYTLVNTGAAVKVTYSERSCPKD